MRALRLPILRGGVRHVMGKPYEGEDWEQLWKHGKKEEEKETRPRPVEKFSKSFQDYLDSVEKDRKKFAEQASKTAVE